MSMDGLVVINPANEMRFVNQQLVCIAVLSSVFDSSPSLLHLPLVCLSFFQCRMFGYETEEDLLGKNVKVLVPHPHQERHDEYISELSESGSSLMLTRFLSFL